MVESSFDAEVKPYLFEPTTCSDVDSDTHFCILKILVDFVFYVISGSQVSECSSGVYYLTVIPNTNTYLLVVDDWTSLVEDTTFGLKCLVERT